MNRDYDTIVVGGGAMGTAAARWLAKRDRNTLLLERFEIGHARGSSGGPTRIFRLTHDHPDSVRMARRALEEWRALEAEGRGDAADHDRRGPIVIGSPCSGHGFKFTPLIGRILADLATAQPTPLPIGRFLTSRFAS